MKYHYDTLYYRHPPHCQCWIPAACWVVEKADLAVWRGEGARDACQPDKLSSRHMSQNLEICKPWSGVSEIWLFLAGIGIRMILLDKDTKEHMEGRRLPTWAVIPSYSHNTGITCLKIAFQAQFLMLRKRGHRSNTGPYIGHGTTSVRKPSRISFQASWKH